MKKLFSLLTAFLAATTMTFAVEVTDVLNNAFTGVSGSSYSEWSGKVGTSGAVYAGQSAGSNSTIQLRSTNNNSGVVTTTSGGTLHSIVVKFNSSTNAARVLDLYASHTPFSSAADLYSSTGSATLVYSFKISEGTELTYMFEESYEYFGVRSNSGALYLDEVDVVWNKGGSTAGGDTIPGDTTYTEPQKVYLMVYSDTTMGQVIGEGEYDIWSTVDVYANPYEGYVFKSWSNGSTDNPLSITLSSDMTLEAFFEPAGNDTIDTGGDGQIYQLPLEGTFDGKNANYTEGWTTTGTGQQRNDCVVIGVDENIKSPAVDLNNYESVTITIKARRYGTLTGSKATIVATFNGIEIGQADASTTSATTALSDIIFSVPEGIGQGSFVFTCSNATQAGSTGNGAGINSITITGIERAYGGDTISGDTIPQTTEIMVDAYANDSTMGYVEGGGTFYVEDEAPVTLQLYAMPYEGYMFAGWEDGNTDNPRMITLAAGNETNYYSFMAYFMPEQIDTIPDDTTFVQSRTIYLEPGGQDLWEQSGAVFFAYAFNGAEEVSVLMNYETDGMYSADIPEDMKYIIFVRMPEGSTELNWNTKWNQTSDLALLEENRYNITGWGESDGYWDVYDPTAPQYVEIFVDAFSFDTIMGYVEGGGVFQYYRGDTMTVTITAVPNDGYKFKGWDDTDISNPRQVMIDGSWTQHSFGAIFEPEGDTVPQYIEIYVDAFAFDSTMGHVIGGGMYQYYRGDTMEVMLHAIPFDGYKFAGWNDGSMENPRRLMIDGTQTQYSFGAEFEADRILHHITFIIDSMVVRIDSLFAGDTIQYAEAPEREGYTFEWGAQFLTMPDEDLVINGFYMPIFYPVMYYVDGEFFYTMQVPYGDSIPYMMEPETTVPGKHFSGWQNVPEFMPADTVIINGYYVANIYTISYFIDGEFYHTDSVAYGDTIPSVAAPQTPEGYYFSGWSETPDIMPASNMTVSGLFYPKWYNITYMLDNAIYHVDSAAYGSSVVAIEAPVREGYVFLGWENLPDTMPAHNVIVTGAFEISMPYTDSAEVAVCESELPYTYVYDGTAYSFNAATDTMLYTKCKASTVGRDSILFFHLTVNPVYSNTISEVICAGTAYEWFDMTYTETGHYSTTLSSVNGCDSVINLTLTVLPTYDISDSASICEGSYFEWHGRRLSEAGNYTDTLYAVSGCDSICHLALLISSNYSYSERRSICEGSFYEWHGRQLTEAGIYTDTLISNSGCDSIFSLQLTVNPTYMIVDSAVVCEGSIFEWHGKQLTKAGFYTDTLVSSLGCDSLMHLALNVNPTYSMSDSAVICEGSFFEWHGRQYTEAGEYSMTLSTVNGCDSVLNLILNVNPLYVTTDSAVICEGGIFEWQGKQLTAAGFYTDTLVSAYGCDSLLNLSLNILPILYGEEEIAICDGSFMEWHNMTLTEAGEYLDTMTAVNGCDSVCRLKLHIHPAYQYSDSAVICEGSAFSWNGRRLTEAGIYTDTLLTINGCDSIVSLMLNINPVFHTADSALICQGETFEWNGKQLTQAGIYTATFAAINGCDSIAELTLNYIPRFALNYIVDSMLYRTDSICAGDSIVLFRPKKDNYTFSGWGDVPTYMPYEDLTLTGYFTFKPTAIVIGQDTISNDTTGVVPVNEEGTMYYNADENTLTLDSAIVENEGLSSDVDNFTLAVENNSTITNQDYGIQFTGDSINITTNDTSMLHVTAPQPISGNGENILYISGNVIFQGKWIPANEVGKRRIAARAVIDGDSVAMIAAVSGFKDVVLAEGIHVCAALYTEEDGTVVRGDSSRAVYHAAESAYGEIDVDTQSFTPATTLVFADSNFYTDYIDGKIDLGDGLEEIAAIINTSNTHKLIVDGTVYIIRNGNWYTVLGRKLR